MNIQIGIDLGTTNSEIAILNGTQVQIVKNTYGDEFTPSVFGVNKAGDEEVGKKPYQRYFKDATQDETLNNKPEIKRLMGLDESVNFPRLNKSYNAEQISGKILSALKQDALRKNANLNANAAVITIPAHFSTLQAEATKRAGALAGFSYVVLLQEPIAAAISYGFGKEKDENYLVYDLGGGTFDCALISCKDGNLKVLGHSGDNFLGGKDIDGIIVESVILPHLEHKYSLNNLRSDSNKTALAKLKYAAEQAKIQLSSMMETNIEVDITLNGAEIYENIPLNRDTLEKLLQPLINRTLECCQKTIDESGIKKEAVDKIILVGGPTQLPFIKEALQSRFGISVDNSSDPLTAVARGACIYAMGQSIPQEFVKSQEIDENSYEIKLNYDSLTNEQSEFITGQVLKLKDGEHFVQIQSEDNAFNTGKIRLKDGKFSAEIVVKPRCLNVYYLFLLDADGRVLETNLNEFSITQGLSVAGAPLPRAIGVAVSVLDLNTGKFKQSYEKFFEKNAIVPLEKTATFKTIKAVKKGDSTNSLPITLYEGESLKPENNLFVCEIALTGEMLNADLYEGSAVDITIKVDESRNVSLEAYIPSLDKAFDARATIFDESVSVESLEKSLQKEVNELEKHLNACSSDEKRQIQSDINEIKQSLQNAKTDSDARSKANAKIKEFQAKAEKIALQKGSQNLKAEFDELEKNVAELVEGLKNDKRDFKQRFEAIKADAQKAIRANDMNLLYRAKDEMEKLMVQIISDDIGFWVQFFAELARNPHFRGDSNAQSIIARGKEAIEDDDADELKSCVQSLMRLLPRSEQESLNTKIAGITR